MTSTHETEMDNDSGFDARDEPPDNSAGGGHGEDGDLFGEVLGAQEPPPAGRLPAVAAETGPLRDSVAGIYEMVKDLEVQLNHMITINEAGERELESARKAQRQLEAERNELKRRVDKMGLDAQSSAELREELRHMTRENERLVEQMRAAQAQAQRLQQARDQVVSGTARLQSERDELAEEVDCLEAQMDETEKVLQRQRTELLRAREARQQQTLRIELIEQRLHVVTDERNALRQELNESRSALEEIKRSIMDTNRQSQLSYYDT